MIGLKRRSWPACAHTVSRGREPRESVPLTVPLLFDDPYTPLHTPLERWERTTKSPPTEECVLSPWHCGYRHAP